MFSQLCGSLKDETSGVGLCTVDVEGLPCSRILLCVRPSSKRGRLDCDVIALFCCYADAYEYLC